MSIRTRLTMATLLLVGLGLVAAGSVTYALLRNSLLERVDEQLIASQGAAARVLVQRGGGPRRQSAPRPGPRGPGGAGAPAATVAELIDPSGKVAATASFGFQDPSALPDLPPALPGSSDYHGESPLFLTVGSEGSDLRYRVLARPAPPFGTLVVAIPLQDVEETLKRLTILEVLVGIAVLSGVGVISALVVRRGLQPLESITATASEIAGGDLGKRVDAPGDRTEIGRLGSALNSMLSRIESAFAQKEASEQRLRLFVADASHELRTPLTSIRGYAELFRRGADVRPDDLAKSMLRIEQESSRMGQMVEELLQLARLDEGRPLDFQEVDLVGVVRDLAGDAAAVAPQWPLAVVAPDAMVVQGDDSRLRQVVSNLINNAVTHTPAGTPVKVTLKTSGKEAVLEVADEGPGMDRGHPEKVFDRFYRVDKARSRDNGGFGLGLSIVAAIVEAHGGRVAAESEPGRGSTFTVTLPLRQPKSR